MAFDSRIGDAGSAQFLSVIRDVTDGGCTEGNNREKPLRGQEATKMVTSATNQPVSLPFIWHSEPVCFTLTNPEVSWYQNRHCSRPGL